ncbi:MAG: hypothetical protein N2044_00370 [Cyclobacteriaceae bacterium]|nr:hypothetical protein [Cyclobacteriaceae bacterium]
MALKVTVKVSSVTNLSDARYCAGMGVQMLGFVTIPGRESYVAPEVFQEMRGWFAGPQVVAEVYGLKQQSELDFILENYRPDLLEGGRDELFLMQASGLPYLFDVSDFDADGLREMILSTHPPAYLIADTNSIVQNLMKLTQAEKVLIRLSDKDSEKYLQPHAQGFVLTSGREERPGLKDYAHLADVLEQLQLE